MDDCNCGGNLVSCQYELGSDGGFPGLTIGSVMSEAIVDVGFGDSFSQW